MVRIAITGIASSFARAVKAQLSVEPNIKKIIYLEKRPPPHCNSEKLEFHTLLA